MKLVIFGLGYTASFYGLYHARMFTEVTGTKRAPKSETLGRVRLLPFDGAAENVDPRVAAAVAEADALLVSAGPDESGDPALRRLAKEIASAPKLKKIIYLSTIGVYGDHGGEWIDETAQPKPSNLRSRQRLAAEAEWFALARASGKEVYVLRLSGIYGPDRNVLVKLREGTAKRLIKPGQVFNRIHVEDIAQAIDACFTGRAPGGVYNVTDDEPAPPQDVVTYAAELLGMEPPLERPFEETPLTPMQRSFYGENKRVSNRRMKALLDLDLAYPTYREGIGALVAEGE
ncbi:SDR family oxidoreductase [Rhodoblastus sp.]|uniref:SDR family oxidoreductase n=1 Tax=Rhodoblastus sp. TaxID=1962975 RepID=UPI002630E569|nr:SDR family oxidoreductase [Rhodoblastus sp.]